MPCSMGYLISRIPLMLWASSPTYVSFWPIPTIPPWWRGRPTMEGKTARGASSPAKPALHVLEPLSITRAATLSSAIVNIGTRCRRHGATQFCYAAWKQWSAPGTVWACIQYLNTATGKKSLIGRELLTNTYSYLDDAKKLSIVIGLSKFVFENLDDKKSHFKCIFVKVSSSFFKKNWK